ncbi:MAG: cation diffusion facilitator family transporter [Rickettsiales bacterium]|nr:cation diffusion facilitator family transporter [Rickettsiales bacterium]
MLAKLSNKSLEKFAGNYAVGAVFIILALKLIGWVQTNSLAILTSLFDSSLDILVSILNLIAIKYAQKPADEDHKFGHTGIEDIIGFAQSVFIFSIAIFIGYESINRIFYPSEIINNTLGIWVILVSTLINLSVVGLYKYTFKRTKSQIIESDSLHYVSDFFTNILVISSLIFIGEAGYYFDISAAIFISAYMLLGSTKIAKRSFDNIMGKEANEEILEKIKSIIHLNSKIIGFHNLKTRYMGRKLIILVDIDISDKLSFLEAHNIADELEKKLKTEFEDCEVTIHTDPHA